MADSLTFDIMHLSNYAIIKNPCTVIVKCNSHLDFDNMYTKDGYNRWIINLKAVTETNLQYIQKLVSLNTILRYDSVGSLLLNGAIWENQALTNVELPAKGEDVIATFDYVDDKLLCTNITIIPRIKPTLFIPSKQILDEIDIFKNLKI